MELEKIGTSCELRVGLQLGEKNQAQLRVEGGLAIGTKKTELQLRVESGLQPRKKRSPESRMDPATGTKKAGRNCELRMNLQLEPRTSNWQKVLLPVELAHIVNYSAARSS